MVEPASDLGAGQCMTREEYFVWAETQLRGRFERVDGVVVAMAPERRSHARRKSRVWRALQQAVEAAGLPCEAYPDGMTISTGDSDFEPDAVVRCGEPLAGDGIDIPDPLIVVEVLSQSTRGVDLTRKLAAYFRVPAVRHYLVIWADEPRVVHHRRRDEDDGIDTRIVTEGEIRLDPPGISVRVGDFYSV